MFAITASASTLLATNKTHNTYMNSTKTFSSTYLTLEDPTIEYRYRNLKCSSSTANLKIKLYSYKIKWYNVLTPSETLVGSKNASGLNASDSTVWYGWTYDDIDCSSYEDILDNFDSMSWDDGYSIRFKYTISNNDSKAIHNDYGQWQVISSY